MGESTWYLIAADAVLFLHFLFVIFVVFSLLLVFFGKFLHWHWIRNLKFRLLHLLAISLVVVQSWLGIICPLTSWEMSLRENAGEVVYSGSFIAHWVESILYYRAPPWVFVVIYTCFALLVLISWFWIKPQDPTKKNGKK